MQNWHCPVGILYHNYDPHKKSISCTKPVVHCSQLTNVQVLAMYGTDNVPVTKCIALRESVFGLPNISKQFIRAFIWFIFHKIHFCIRYAERVCCAVIYILSQIEQYALCFVTVEKILFKGNGISFCTNSHLLSSLYLRESPYSLFASKYKHSRRLESSIDLSCSGT